MHVEKAKKVSLGMSVSKVEKILGKPDGVQKKDGKTILSYVNRHTSTYSPDKTDFYYVFENNSLEAYGTGEIRKHNTGTLFIYDLTPGY